MYNINQYYATSLVTNLVEGDSLLVINCVRGITAPPWRLIHIIQDIQEIAAGFESFSISHIFREAIFVVNSLALLGHSSSGRLDCSESWPRSVIDKINFDLFGTGCPRGSSM